MNAMIRSRNVPAARPLLRIQSRARRVKLLFLARPRLISNLLALVALFSIGFV